MEDLDVAVVHKQFVDYGGAERVAEALARAFDAPLYVGFSDPDVTPDVEVIDLFDDSFVLSLARRSGVLREVYSLDAWEHQPELASYDVLVQTAPQPGWYVPAEGQTIVRYVHDLPRTIYDQFQRRDQTFVSQTIARIYRVLYATQARYVDEWVVNSEYVQERLATYLDEDSTVVYPPVDVEQFEPQETEDFYLTYSRLSERKRVHDVVEAFAEMPDRDLVVGGTGPMAEEIADQAADLPNVEYRGYLSEAEKVDLLGRARAVIFGAETESFGIVPVEAFASGTPVIGVDSGYTRYHVEDGVNGYLFEWSGNGLAETVDRFETVDIENEASELKTESQNFTEEQFEDAIFDIIRDSRDQLEAPSVVS